MLLHARDRAPRAELQVGIGGGEVHARARLAGLDDDRPALRRRQCRQRSAHVEIAPSKIDAMHLGRVGENAVLAVGDQGVRLDAVPQRAGDLEKLLRALIALVVLHHFSKP